jgi:DNA-binding response OmpR family regulator
VTFYAIERKKKRILLVDDERDIVSVMKTGLENRGYFVDGYTGPQTALENFKPNFYDHVILDIRMPDMNGFDLARQIWAKDPNANVCFLSAFEIYADESDKVFKDFNTRCFMKKPITASNLVEHLEKHQARA